MELIAWILENVKNFLVDLYLAGGPQIRWVMFIWLAFAGVYALLGAYEHIHRKDIIKLRKKRATNYYYTLHAYLILTVVFEYGYLMYEWPVFYPIARKMQMVWVTVGYGLLILGFLFVILGRLYINSFWGKDVYEYPAECGYELVTRNVYGKCRHPIYFGQTCMSLGTALVLNNWLALAFSIALTAVNVTRAKREEKWLKDFFKEEWTEYKNETNFLLPFL